MKSIRIVFKEQIDSFYLIKRLSVYEVKSKNDNRYLGFLWEVINPLIQIAIYWFVFGFGIRRGADVDGIPFFHWMLAGIVVWFFVNPAILEGSKSIYQRIKMVAKMSFPVSVIPTYVILANFYQHLLLLAIVLVILWISGAPLELTIIQLPYYFCAAIAFLVSLTIVTSTLTTIIRDIQMVIQSVMRMLMYVTPILWTVDHLPEAIQKVMKLNPLFYLVEGYRSALLGTGWYFIDHPLYTVYFWGVTFFLFWIGASMHIKFRGHFVDYA